MVIESASSDMQNLNKYSTTQAWISSRCDEDVGDCVHEDDREIDHSRLILAQSRYISYGALQRDNVPCNVRGNSYYNCNSHQQANPYRRGCSQITHCARNNH
ncbi:protein RALF-like 33 [Dorcoceras hygrometricum]|uniref:Protein RALF-like 33 n=1 Tax=Dorcoceras hygrometricum TaxID=472368 RepID=A0A2Z7BXW3_9LAMI|nr:protein RALF-like 33 [Dorcoceras hygrometricum]